MNEAWFEEDEYKQKRKVLEAGVYISIAWMGVIPGGQIPALVTSILMAGLPAAEGVYDASRAQDLVQAWIESGIWTEKKPYKLEGLWDRANVRHDITYDYLLTEKGMVPYLSPRADGLLSGWFEEFQRGPGAPTCTLPYFRLHHRRAQEELRLGGHHQRVDPALRREVRFPAATRTSPISGGHSS